MDSNELTSLISERRYSKRKYKFKLEDFSSQTVMEMSRKLGWYVPVFMYYILTFEFIEDLLPFFSKLGYKKLKIGKEKLEIAGKVLKIAIQGLLFLFLAFEVMLQFILFITDSVYLNVDCCNYSKSGEDTFQEVMFVTDFINSIVALGCCYFIYVNSKILKKEVKFENMPKDQIIWKCKLPSGKSKFFSRIGIFLAYTIILLLPLTLTCAFKRENSTTQIYYFGSANTFIDLFPEILKNSGCNLTKEHIDMNVYMSIDYLMEFVNTIQWHMSPVLACVAIRYICKHLQNEIEHAVKRSKEYIEEKWQGITELGNVNDIETRNGSPIQEFYTITKLVRKYSNKLYYISSLNIFSVGIIVANIFVSYMNDSDKAFAEKFSRAKKEENVDEMMLFRTVFVYIYQFIGVWLMSDGIIGVNTQLAKFSDEINSDTEIMDKIFGENTGRLKEFAEGIKQELSMIAESKERFEIAFFGDFSTSLFYTIIPIGLTTMVSFVVRAIHASRFLYCPS